MKEKKTLMICKKICTIYKNTSVVKIFFDEKNDVVDSVLNRGNDKFIAKTCKDVKGIFRSKHPVQVMAFGVIRSDGNKMPFYFFKPGEKKHQCWVILPNLEIPNFVMS